MQKSFNSVPLDKKAVKLRKKAYDAFNNAKQRCENPNNPSFSQYGKLGVKVLIPNFDAFLDHIGLPPTEAATLDRIHAAGNYEIGNIRWANPSLQAYNKKTNPLASQLTIQKQTTILLDQKTARKRREAVSEAWNIVVNAIRLGGFSPANIEFLSSNKLSPEMFEAGWDPGQVPDFSEPPSYFFMPSLTQLGRRIRIQGGPLPTAPIEHDGVIPRLDILLGSGFDAIKRPFATHGNGAVLIGGKGEDWLRLGGVEGIMMVVASKMKHKGYKVAIFPLLTTLAKLKSLGSRYKWDEVKSCVLDNHALFIPDFQISYGDAVQPNPQEWSLLTALIDYRLEHGKRTYLGVQNINGMPSYVTAKLLLDFFVRELPEKPKVETHPDHVATGPKTSALGFSDLQAALSTALYKL